MNIKFEDLEIKQNIKFKARDVLGKEIILYGYIKHIEGNSNFFIAEIIPTKGKILSDSYMVSSLNDIIEIIV